MPVRIVKARRKILRNTKKGIYAKTFGGGQVDITNGKFVFSASEAYLIENGKITKPIKRKLRKKISHK